jgi:hypothetical protein
LEQEKLFILITDGTTEDAEKHSGSPKKADERAEDED